MQESYDSSKESMDTQRQKYFKVLLIGETCVDQYHFGVCDRICPEAPVPVFSFLREENRFGMGANVKSNLESFGVSVDFVTNHESLIIKRRFVDTKSNQLLLREDIELPIQPVSLVCNLNLLEHYDAVVVSDYDKGLISNEQITQLLTAFNGPVFVDSKKTDLSLYENCIIKINSEEENKVVKYPNKSEVIVTLGKNGAKHNDIHFPAPKVDVFDVTGAGDVFLASLCFYFLSTYNIKEAIQKAVILASKSVQHLGIYTVTKNDIEDLI